MKRLSEAYKLYRDVALFKALFESLEDLGENEELPTHMMPLIVHKYDEVVFQVLKGSTENFSFTGELELYRMVPPMRYFWLRNVTIVKDTGIGQSPPDCQPSGGKKLKKRPTWGNRKFKLDTLRIWTYDPVDDNNLVVVDDASSPYCVEVESKAKVKKPKMKLLKLKKETSSVSSTYDPLMHVKELSQGSSFGRGKDQKANFLAPMPYNEKLRRGGADNALLIAETQLGKLEILKGRYRKAATEYPIQKIQDYVKANIDLSVVDGKKINARKYKTLMRHQDRVLADMAARAGGSLALTPHNILVTPGKRSGPGVVRESYSTRRKERIELASFDTSKSFARVPKPVKSIVIHSSSSSEEESGAEEEGQEVTEKDLDLFQVNKVSPKMTLRLKRGISPGFSDNSSGTSASSVEANDWSMKEKRLSQMKEDLILESLREMSLPKDLGVSLELVKTESQSRANSLEKRIIKNKIDEDFSLFNETQTF